MQRMSIELQRRLTGAGVTSKAARPGFVPQVIRKFLPNFDTFDTKFDTLSGRSYGIIS